MFVFFNDRTQVAANEPASFLSGSLLRVSAVLRSVETIHIQIFNIHITRHRNPPQSEFVNVSSSQTLTGIQIQTAANCGSN